MMTTNEACVPSAPVRPAATLTDDERRGINAVIEEVQRSIGWHLRRMYLTAAEVNLIATNDDRAVIGVLIDKQIADVFDGAARQARAALHDHLDGARSFADAPNGAYIVP